MKLLSTFCLLSLFAGGLQAQINLDSGLVAHWEMDGNALDSGPYMFDGVAAGPADTTDRFGMAAHAYAFNGTSDRVNLPPVFATIPTAVTFSAWFKVPPTYPEGKLVHHAQSGEFSMWTNTDTVVVAVHLGNSLPDGWIWAAQKFIDDHWHFVAGRWEYGQSIDLYYDGQIVSSSPAPAMDMMDPGPQFQASLGNYRPYGISYYAGLLDDARIYERALSNAELDALYNDMTTSVPERSNSAELNLFQNQPNPANGSTTISFNQPTAGAVSLRIYDLNGRLLSEVENGLVSAGTHAYMVDLSNMGAGVYLYELRSAGSVLTRKLLVE